MGGGPFLDPFEGIFFQKFYLGATMPLSIKDAETERLARRLADVTGESITRATKRALEERLRRVESPARRAALLEDLAAIRRSCRDLPVLDNRSADEIIGYDENGLPT